MLKNWRFPASGKPGKVSEVATPPDIRNPVSQACTQAQMQDPIYRYWCRHIGEGPVNHRKQWEFVYILQALARAGMLAPGMRGLGFGVGEEPLASAFAARGAEILATDLDTAEAANLGWVATDQHAAGKAALNQRGLCEPAGFEEKVEFRFLDMNAIPAELTGQFDFCWSACAYEHLGNIELGLQFVINSVACLRPGGVAVHTTELNCSSDDKTLAEGSTVLFRQRDFRDLARRLAALGCEVELNFNLGDQPHDLHIDVPPYSGDPHLKLQIAQWTSTSFGIIARKPLT